MTESRPKWQGSKVREVAVAASCSATTVRRWCKGLPVQPAVDRAIRRAAGLEVDEPWAGRALDESGVVALEPAQPPTAEAGTEGELRFSGYLVGDDSQSKPTAEWSEERGEFAWKAFGYEGYASSREAVLTAVKMARFVRRMIRNLNARKDDKP